MYIVQSFGCIDLWKIVSSYRRMIAMNVEFHKYMHGKNKPYQIYFYKNHKILVY